MIKPVNLIHKIQLLLEPMGKVNYLISDTALFFEKDNITFGKVAKDKVYLVDKNGLFQQIESKILNIQDEFLKEATQSYWSAKMHNLVYIKIQEK